MTKSTIRSNLSTFNSDIAAVRAKGLDYVLGETNSYSCHVCDPLGSLYVPFAHRFIFFLPGCTRCEQHCWRCTVDVRLPTLRVCAHSFVLRIQHITSAYHRSQIGISRVFFHQGVGFKYSLVCYCRLIFQYPLNFENPDPTSNFIPFDTRWVNPIQTTSTAHPSSILCCDYRSRSNR